MESIRHALPLYCISSKHGFCTYTWSKLGEADKTFPSSAVIYVMEVGLYQCCVESDGEHVTTHVFAVRVYAGRLHMATWLHEIVYHKLSITPLQVR